MFLDESSHQKKGRFFEDYVWSGLDKVDIHEFSLSLAQRGYNAKIQLTRTPRHLLKLSTTDWFPVLCERVRDYTKSIITDNDDDCYHDDDDDDETTEEEEMIENSANDELSTM